MPTRLNDGEGSTDGQVIDARPQPIRRGNGHDTPGRWCGQRGRPVVDEASSLYAVFQGGGPSGSRTGS